MSRHFLNALWKEKLCLAKWRNGRIFLGKRGHLFSKMEGRRQVNITQPPPSPAQSPAPSRVKCRPSIPQTHYVLSTPVPLGRLFLRLLILFPFSTNSKFSQGRAQYCCWILWTPLLMYPAPPLPTDWISFPLPCAPRRGLRYGKYGQYDMADSPTRPISSTLSPPQTNTNTHTAHACAHLTEHNRWLWLSGWTQEPDNLSLRPSFVPH